MIIVSRARRTALSHFFSNVKTIHYAFYFQLVDEREFFKCLAATMFLFFACLAPAIGFGGLFGVVTGGDIGTMEVRKSINVHARGFD